MHDDAALHDVIEHGTCERCGADTAPTCEALEGSEWAGRTVCIDCIIELDPAANAGAVWL